MTSLHSNLAAYLVIASTGAYRLSLFEMGGGAGV